MSLTQVKVLNSSGFRDKLGAIGIAVKMLCFCNDTLQFGRKHIERYLSKHITLWNAITNFGACSGLTYKLKSVELKPAQCNSANAN